MDYHTPVMTQIRIRPNDLDQLGHVNNAVVLEYFELGRWDWMAHFDLKNSDRILPVVARIEVDYRNEIKSGSVDLVTTLIPSDKSYSYQANFEHKLVQYQSEQEVVVAQGKVKVAFINADTRMLASLQEFLEDNTSQELQEMEYAVT